MKKFQRKLKGGDGYTPAPRPYYGPATTTDGNPLPSKCTCNAERGSALKFCYHCEKNRLLLQGAGAGAAAGKQGGAQFSPRETGETGPPTASTGGPAGGPALSPGGAAGAPPTYGQPGSGTQGRPPDVSSPRSVQQGYPPPESAEGMQQDRPPAPKAGSDTSPPPGTSPWVGTAKAPPVQHGYPPGGAVVVGGATVQGASPAGGNPPPRVPREGTSPSRPSEGSTVTGGGVEPPVVGVNPFAAEVPPQEESLPPPTVRPGESPCPQCGHGIPPSARFCFVCGLSRGTAGAPPPKPPPKPSSNTTAGDGRPESVDYYAKPAPTPTAPDAVPVAPSPHPEQSNGKCNTCGEILSADAMACFLCGEPTRVGAARRKGTVDEAIELITSTSLSRIDSVPDGGTKCDEID